MKYKPGLKMFFLPIEIIYDNELFNGSLKSIKSKQKEYYTIDSIWHKKGYSISGPNDARGETPFKKIYTWNGKEVSKKEYKHLMKTERFIGFGEEILTCKEVEKKSKRNTIITFQKSGGLTVPLRVVKDNFISVKKLRKLKIEKIEKS
jgi:hypothetical protein